MITIGDKRSFAFRLLPLAGAPPEADPAASVTWAALEVWVRNRNLTAHTHPDLGRFDHGLHWPVIYLVRWFVRNWRGFFLDQRPPLRGFWRNARDLCDALDSRLLALEDAASESEVDEFVDLRDSYVLAYALRAASGGGLFPGLYLLRDGARLSVSWSKGDQDSDVWFHLDRSEADVSHLEFLDCVAGLADWVCEQLERLPRGTVDVDLSEIKAWRAAIDQPSMAEESLWG